MIWVAFLSYLSVFSLSFLVKPHFVSTDPTNVARCLCVCVCVCVNQGQRGGKHHVSFKIPIGSMGQTVYLPTNLPMEKQAFM